MNWFYPINKNSLINAVRELDLALPYFATSLHTYKIHIRNIFIAISTGILCSSGPVVSAEPLGMEWFTSSGTGNGVFQIGTFFVDGVKYSGLAVGDAEFSQLYVVRIGGAGAAPDGAQDGLGDEASHSGGVPGGSGGAGGGNASPHCASIAPGSSSVCITDAIGGGGNNGNVGLGFDPLGINTALMGGHIDVADSGNGTNDPTTAVVRMVLDDGNGFYQEFLKDSMNYKQKITETMTAPELVVHVEMDMRAIDFNTMNASAPFLNTLTFTDPAETYNANFNQAIDAQNSNVTAGQYVYLPRGGWGAPNGYAAGYYLFSDGGGFNIYDNDVYSFYYNPAQNVGNEATNNSVDLNACAATSTCVLPFFAQD